MVLLFHSAPPWSNSISGSHSASPGQEAAAGYIAESPFGVARYIYGPETAQHPHDRRTPHERHVNGTQSGGDRGRISVSNP